MDGFFKTNFLLILFPILGYFFKLHFANNLGIHSSVFDNRYLNETFDNYIYLRNYKV